MDLAQPGARVGRRGERSHGNVRMSDQQPRDLATGVAAGSCNGRPDHAHDYTHLWEFMQNYPRGSDAPHGRRRKVRAPSPITSPTRPRKDSGVSTPALTNRPDQASSSPLANASIRFVTSVGSVHWVRPRYRSIERVI